MSRLIAVLLAACAMNLAAQNMASEAQGEELAASATKLRPPAVKFTGATSTHGHTLMTFEVANPNDVPLPYVGYTSESFEGGLPAGTISPLYRIELQKDGAWKAHSVGFCGTGVGPVTLPARSKVTFGVLRPGGEWDAAKVGLVWSDAATDGKEGAVTWSSPITPQDLAGEKPQPTK